MSDIGGVGPVESSDITPRRAEARQSLATQVASKRAFSEETQEAFNPFAADKEIEFKALEERHTPVLTEEEKLDQQERVHEKQDADASADQRERDNPELKATELTQLRRLVMNKLGRASAEEIIADVRSFFRDPSLADEAMDYLIETTEGDVQENVREAKERLNAELGREVRAGRNMGPESRAYADALARTPTDLRELYRDITGNPREQNALFKELANQFSYEELKSVIKFLLQSIGSDLKSKGPSIPRGELYRLVTEGRVLQSILGVYLFFQKREKLIRKLLAQKGLSAPPSLEFEKLSEEFMELVSERYPTTAKIYRIAAELGISEEILTQIIVFEQYRDAIREVAPRLFKSLKHRYDLLSTLIEALEELEDELEEDEDEL